jgi:hypothetical protein
MNSNEQIRILCIFHYVVGSLYALFGCMGFFHLFIGLSFMLNPHGMLGSQGIHTSPSDLPPPWFGVIFALVGGSIILFGWLLGLLTILSGRFISRRVHYTYSIVIGAINCVMFPFGTALGVFDIILLSKDEMKKQYRTEQDAAANP